MGSDLYVARVVDSRTVVEPPEDAEAYGLGEFFAEALTKLGLGENDAVSYPDFRARIGAWAKERKAEDAASKLGHPFFQPRIIAALRKDPTSLGEFDLGYVHCAWVGHAILARAHPKRFPALEALRLTIEAVTIHDDAGLPPEGSRLVRPFATRLLSEAIDQVKKSKGKRTKANPISAHFVESLASGGHGDDLYGVVPFARCEAVIPMDAEGATARAGWWADDSLVREHFPRAASTGQPFGIGRISLTTFPSWVPAWSQESFHSRAYGWL